LGLVLQFCQLEPLNDVFCFVLWKNVMGGFLKSAFFPDPDLEAGLAVTEGLAPGVMFINIFFSWQAKSVCLRQAFTVY